MVAVVLFSVMVSALLTISVAWGANFGLRFYVEYEVAVENLAHAVDILKLASHPNQGSNYRRLHATDVSAARQTIRRSPWSVAQSNTLEHTYLCGNKPCTEFVFGDLSIARVAGSLLVIAFAFSIIGNVVIALVSTYMGAQQIMVPLVKSN